MMLTKSLDDYAALPYTIESVPDDGVWFVRIKELPGCATEVDTWEDILPAIEDAKNSWLEAALERGRAIPVPQSPRRRPAAASS